MACYTACSILGSATSNVLLPGEKFVLEDVAGGRFEAYDSLAKVYGLYATLSNDPKLAEFAFLLNWPKLKPEEKMAGVTA